MAVSFDFSNKVIAVTGAASGRGLESAKLLAAAGAKLSISEVQAEALTNAASTLEKFNGQVLATVVDVTNESQVRDWLQNTVDKFGKLDGAANMAGVIGSGMRQKAS